MLKNNFWTGEKVRLHIVTGDRLFKYINHRTNR